MDMHPGLAHALATIGQRRRHVSIDDSLWAAPGLQEHNVLF